MTSVNVILGKIVESGLPFKINLDDIIEDRALVQANSRGGKSYILRKLCEKLFGLVQIIMIEPEGEYYTLREKFDFLLIGNKQDGADIQVTPKIAELLANKLLESGTSAIIDLSELLTPDKIKFVKLFADKLANESNKSLWHPVVVILDEAHIFAPEKGQGEAESLNAVMALASKGGKRGYALVAATQRPSKLSKNITTELNTKFIGRAGSYDDIQRAKQELGLPKSTPDTMFKIKHEFYVIGPGVDGIVRIKADEVETTHKTNHLNYKTKVSTPAKIRNNLSVFEDIPEEAEKELKTKEDLQNKIKELTDTITVLKANLAHEQATKSPFSYDPKKLQEQYLKGVTETEKFYQIKIKELFAKYSKLYSHLEKIPILAESIRLDRLQDTDFSIKRENPYTKDVLIEVPSLRINIPTVEQMRNHDSTIFTEGISIPKGGAMRLLRAAAKFYPNAIGHNRICLLAELSPESGSTSTYLSELRTKGLIESQTGLHQCTQLGYQTAGNIESLPSTHKELLDMWLRHLSGKEKDILIELCKQYPHSLNKQVLAQQVGMSPDSGSYSTYLSKLRSNKLIVNTPQGFAASEDLFP